MVVGIVDSAVTDAKLRKYLNVRILQRKLRHFPIRRRDLPDLSAPTHRTGGQNIRILVKPATQFQVVVPGDLNRFARPAIFHEIVGSIFVLPFLNKAVPPVW
ncbi:hypothetical protein D3C81_1744720 [compost metagenome]